MTANGAVLNYIGGQWRVSTASEHLDVVNPATIELLGKVPLSSAYEVNEAAQAAAEAFPEWRSTPVPDRIQYLFKLKHLLDENFEDLSRTLRWNVARR